MNYYFNYLLKALLLLLIMSSVGCTPPRVSQDSIPPDTSQTLQTLAFGSCNKVNLSQKIWKSVSANQPDLWVWLGDIIYADTENMDKMKIMYDLQKTTPEYADFISRTPTIGIWDDHDYGVNDGGKSYPKKAESQQLMLDFLGVPKNAPVRSQQGIYQSYTFGNAPQTVKIILLDCRYFQDELKKSSSGESRYLINPTGAILGETQWKWLESELTNSTAAIHIICSSIQIIPNEQGFEKWGNFPSERQRFFDLITKTKPSNTLILSGDRHIAEVSKINLEGMEQPLYEVTSSGLTHAYSEPAAKVEKNKYRIGNLINEKNFAILKINWETFTITTEIHGANNELLLSQILK